MTSEMKQTIKHNFWKFFGSMLMERKEGIQAASLHRVLALILFVACMVLWFWAERQVPDSMLYTLWGLLGINGAHKVAGAIKSPVSAGKAQSVTIEPHKMPSHASER